jgi:general secretion pathway protein G
MTSTPSDTSAPDRSQSVRAQPEPSSGDEGFTLLELLVVLAILGLLAAIVAPQVLKYLGSSRSQAAKVQIENISAALDHFDLDTGHYPTADEGGLDALVKALQKPTALIDPWRRKYLYRAPGGHNNDFDVWSYGSDGVAGGANEARDVGNW